MRKEPLPWVDWQGTVYHGLPLDQYEYKKTQEAISLSWGGFSGEKSRPSH
jgi:hypothetical protein